MEDLKRMNFDALDKEMREYEKALDQVVMSGLYMIARLDGRGFSKLTAEILKLNKPFDDMFRDWMVEVTESLVKNSGLNIVYAYTQSDEISLLFRLDETAFNRKIRKYNSLLAGLASAKMSMLVRRVVTFDCRMLALPNLDKVADYFVWRQEDCNRNTLNGYCYWTLRNEGKSAREVTRTLSSKGVAFKNELLFEHGINYNDVEAWKKRGIGIYFKTELKDGYNPITKETVKTERNKMVINSELPYGDEYLKFITEITPDK